MGENFNIAFDNRYRQWLLSLTNLHNISQPISNNIRNSSYYQPRQTNISNISNTDQHAPVGGGGGMPWLMIATIAATNVGSFFANTNPGIYSSDLLRDANRSVASIDGVGFERQNRINEDRIHSEYKKELVSNIWKGNFGGFIGGLIGRSELEELIHNAQMLANRTNAVNQDLAMSQGVLSRWYDKHGDTYNQIRPIQAAHGIDALASTGEVQGDMRTGDAVTLDGGVPGRDDIPTTVDDNTFILSDKEGYARLARPLVQYQQYLKSLIDSEKTPKNKLIKENVLQKELNKTRDGIILIAEALRDEHLRLQDMINNISSNAYSPVRAEVGLDSLVVNGLTALLGVEDYIKTNNSSIAAPYTYRPNLYFPAAFDKLRKLSVDPTYITNKMRDLQYLERYKLSLSGGLSTSLKMAGNIALTANSQRNTADMLFNYYNLLNNIKAKTAELELGEGRHAAQMMQNAALWDLDYYSKAHGARLAMINASLANIFGSLRQYVADKDKRDRWKSMMNLYYLEHPELKPKTKQEINAENAVDRVFGKSTIFNPDYDNFLPTSSVDYGYANGVLPRAYKKRMGLL